MPIKGWYASTRWAQFPRHTEPSFTHAGPSLCGQQTLLLVQGEKCNFFASPSYYGRPQCHSPDYSQESPNPQGVKTVLPMLHFHASPAAQYNTPLPNGTHQQGAVQGLLKHMLSNTAWYWLCPPLNPAGFCSKQPLNLSFLCSLAGHLPVTCP